jgi:hypothetical protein
VKNSLDDLTGGQIAEKAHLTEKSIDLTEWI